MNLHFIPNNGFINSFLEIVESLSMPGQNIYFICKGDSRISKPQSDKIISKNIFVEKYGTQEFYHKIGDITKFEKIYIHFLDDQMCDFVLRNATYKIKFYWLFWGADLYTPIEYFSEEVFDEISLKYFIDKNTFATSSNRIINFWKFASRKLFNSNISKRQFQLRKQAIKRIDFFCHYNKLDFELMRNRYTSNAEFLPFFYFEYDYSKFSMVHEINALRKQFHLKTKYVIQIGHSASLTNNHISVLEWLSDLSDEDISILCPLSYGDKRYAKYVSKIGTEIFGTKFLPITKYYSKSDYLKLLSCVDVAIMNHKRTEAAGNIFMMLALGKKIYCNQKSNLYQYLHEKNVMVELIDFTSKASLSQIVSPLESEEKERNHSIILKEFSLYRAEDLITNLLYS